MLQYTGRCYLHTPRWRSDVKKFHNIVKQQPMMGYKGENCRIDWEKIVCLAINSTRNYVGCTPDFCSAFHTIKAYALRVVKFFLNFPLSYHRIFIYWCFIHQRFPVLHSFPGRGKYLWIDGISNFLSFQESSKKLT